MPPLPDEGALSALTGFLTGSGAPLVEFHDEMAVLLTDGADAEDCRSLVDDLLPDVADSPAALRALAESVPDKNGRDIIINELTVGFETLGRCVSEEEILEVDELEFHYSVVDSWLNQVGVER